MPETTTSENENAQIKPIVSDIMTVSSKETLDSRDDKDIGSNEADKKHHPVALAPQGRYPTNQPPPQRAPFPHNMPPSRGPYGPPPSYFAYAQPHHHPPHHHHHQQYAMMHPSYGQPHFITRTNGGPPMPHHAPMGHPPHGAPSSHHHGHPFYHHGMAATHGHYMNNGSMHISAYSTGGRDASPPSASVNSASSSILGKKRHVDSSNIGQVFGDSSNTNRRTEGKDRDETVSHNSEDHILSLAQGDRQKDTMAKHSHKTHRRSHSGASTASSLSVGVYSFASYEATRGKEDHEMTDIQNSSPKRRKGNQLAVDTTRPESSCSQSLASDKGFEQLSIDKSAKQPIKLPASTSSASSAGHGNLFLSLSTSPINQDIDQTPIKKNSNRQTPRATTEPENVKAETKGPSSIFKLKITIDRPKLETTLSDVSRPSDTPTPPASQSDLVRSSSMTDEHSLLNRHLRIQTFTPLPHLSTAGSSGASPSAAAFASAMAAPQLSWSIAGDTPSLGDLADWDDEANHRSKSDQKPRPGSATSVSSARNMAISPQEFQFWKEDHDLADVTMSGTTTPLPAFFDQGMKDGSEACGSHLEGKMQQGSAHSRHRSQPSSSVSHLMMWQKGSEDELTGKLMSAVPPTPMFSHSEHRDDIHFGPRSPSLADRRDRSMEYGVYPGFQSHHPPGGYPPNHNERVRNLRGRMPHSMHMPPLPLHIPPPMSSHLPMASPMGVGSKAGLWSPHHHHSHNPFHGGMHPSLSSPHHHHPHLGMPMSTMAQSKRKCVPLKPPIPSKFQGDMESAKSAPVPEFTSLVNFPAHMSQKQSANLPEGMRCCVMCGQACQCTFGTKAKKCNGKKGSDGMLSSRGSNGQDCVNEKSSGFAIIPSQNKGLCTLCDVNVWVIVSSGLEIKWCKGCKNFRPWAAFGEKGLATKCLRCRDRQREKYALQKEEKEKGRMKIKK